MEITKVDLDFYVLVIIRYWYYILYQLLLIGLVKFYFVCCDEFDVTVDNNSINVKLTIKLK